MEIFIWLHRKQYFIYGTPHGELLLQVHTSFQTVQSVSTISMLNWTLGQPVLGLRFHLMENSGLDRIKALLGFPRRQSGRRNLDRMW
jgi:hypothetical protein